MCTHNGFGDALLMPRPKSQVPSQSAPFGFTVLVQFTRVTGFPQGRHLSKQAVHASTSLGMKPAGICQAQNPTIDDLHYLTCI